MRKFLFVALILGCLMPSLADAQSATVTWRLSGTEALRLTLYISSEGPRDAGYAARGLADVGNETVAPVIGTFQSGSPTLVLGSVVGMLPDGLLAIRLELDPSTLNGVWFDNRGRLGEVFVVR